MRITSSQIYSRMTIGETVTLRVSVVPAKADSAVTWSTSDASVLQIDQNGKLTAIGAGTATVTATANKGQKKAQTEITVEKPKASSMELKEEDQKFTMQLNETRSLKPVILPLDAEQKVTYTCSDPNVVSIDEEGLVTAVNPGTVIVTITSLDEYFEVTSEITIEKPADPEPEKPAPQPQPQPTVAPQAASVTISQTTLTLKQGQMAALSASVAPADADQKIVWSTANAAVASVDASGIVTAAGAGTTVITAASADGTKSASCTVTVQIPATKVTLNTTKLYLVKGKSIKIKGKLTPDQTTDKITWTTSKKSVATVKNGKIKAKKTGMAKITATATNGKKAVCKVYVVKKAIPSISVKLNKKKATLKKGKFCRCLWICDSKEKRKSRDHSEDKERKNSDL